MEEFEYPNLNKSHEDYEEKVYDFCLKQVYRRSKEGRLPNGYVDFVVECLENDEIDVTRESLLESLRELKEKDNIREQKAMEEQQPGDAILELPEPGKSDDPEEDNSQKENQSSATNNNTGASKGKKRKATGKRKGGAKVSIADLDTKHDIMVLDVDGKSVLKIRPGLSGPSTGSGTNKESAQNETESKEAMLDFLMTTDELDIVFKQNWECLLDCLDEECREYNVEPLRDHQLVWDVGMPSKGPKPPLLQVERRVLPIIMLHERLGAPMTLQHTLMLFNYLIEGTMFQFKLKASRMKKLSPQELQRDDFDLEALGRVDRSYYLNFRKRYNDLLPDPPCKREWVLMRRVED